MPTILSQLETVFAAAIKAAFGIDADPILAPTQSDKFGDYQSNAAMGLAKQLSKKPREVADQIKAKLDLGNIASEVTIAGPGFINIRLNPTWIAELLQQAASAPRMAIDTAAIKKRVVIDYSSPNVAKQMHIGHLRPTNIGDAISRIVEFQGHEVIRQNHLGDWGTQFGMLLTYLRETGTADNAETHIADLDAFYKAAKKRFDEDKVFADEARQMVVRLQAGDAGAHALWQRIMDESRRHFQAIYDRMDVKMRREHERGESFYNPMLADVVRELKEKAIAVESQGAIAVFVEGFEAPILVQKSGGGFGYATTDLAALRFRINELHANRIIYVTDARQAQHFRQFLDAAKRAGWTDAVEVDHIMFGMILGSDGTPFKARSGESVKLIDVLNEAEQRGYDLAKRKAEERNVILPEEQLHTIGRAVGIGGIKYFDLARDAIGNYTFDWEQMLATDGNTAPYLQYAYARIKSIFRRAQERDIAYAPTSVSFDSPFELALLKQVLRFGEIINLVARELKPHHLCTYLYELSQKFSSFFENCPVLQSEEPTRSSRLALCDATAKTLALGLDLLGIAHPEQM